MTRALRLPDPRALLPDWELRSTVGVAASASELRAVGVRNGRVLWAMRAERGPEEPIDHEIAALLRATPAGRSWPRPRVVLAVGGAESQVKRLPNLPAASPRVLDGIVREGCGRFFRKNGVPIETGGALRRGENVWAAAYERPLVDAVERGCRATGLSLQAAVPAALAAAYASLDDVVRWSDGEHHLEVARSASGLESVRAVPMAFPATSQRPVHSLAVLGADAWSYADAYGAAAGGRREALALRVARRGESRDRKVRLGVALAACAVAWTATIALPAARLARNAARAQRQLAVLAPARRDYSESALQLDIATKQLAELARFDARRGRATALLAQLAAALPLGSAIVALRMDSTTATLVGVAPQASALVEAIERLPGVASPEIVGPITREVVATPTTPASPAQRPLEVERVTVRFRLIPQGRGGSR